MTEHIRWGILGTGFIAHRLAESLRDAPGARLVAVGSRTAAAAAEFGAEFDLPNRHGSYAELAADPEVDVIYVSTPHNRHCEDTILCLEHGKHVLCEKPFAIHAEQAERMIACARHHRRFLMEAMWTRFNPVMAEVRKRLAAGVIGEPRMLLIDFGFQADFDPASRLFDAALGGGALLDVGVYCVSLAHMVFGGPAEHFTGTAHLGATGVDEQSAWLFRYPNGALAVLSCAVRTETPQTAVLCGDRGQIRIPRFWSPTGFECNGETVSVDIVGNAYQYQAIEVMRCIRAGHLESTTMSLSMTLAIQRDLDRIRAAWGLRYPTDPR